MRSKFAVVVLCAASSLPFSALAQRPAAVDAAAPVAPLKYESAFSTYRQYQDQRVRNWAELNEEVREAGGHVGIFRGAGHDTHHAPKAPAQAPLGEGQPPVRGAPEAPQSKPHH